MRKPKILKQDRYAANGLKAAIIYESLAAGLRGKELVDQIMALDRWGRRCPDVVWRGELLDIAPLGEEAAAEVRSADFIVVALSGEGVAGRVICEWVEARISNWSEHLVFLVVISQAHPAHRAVVDATLQRLRALSLETGVAFFSHILVATRP
jgi:hypothetical protein